MGAVHIVGKVFKPGLVADEGAAGTVAQGVERAAGNQPHNGGIAGGGFIQRGNTCIKPGQQFIGCLLHAKNGGDGTYVGFEAVDIPGGVVNGKQNSRGNVGNILIFGAQPPSDENDIRLQGIQRFHTLWFCGTDSHK